MKQPTGKQTNGQNRKCSEIDQVAAYQNRQALTRIGSCVDPNRVPPQVRQGALARKYAGSDRQRQGTAGQQPQPAVYDNLPARSSQPGPQGEGRKGQDACLLEQGRESDEPAGRQPVSAGEPNVRPAQQHKQRTGSTQPDPRLGGQMGASVRRATVEQKEACQRTCQRVPQAPGQQCGQRSRNDDTSTPEPVALPPGTDPWQQGWQRKGRTCPASCDRRCPGRAAGRRECRLPGSDRRRHRC